MYNVECVGMRKSIFSSPRWCIRASAESSNEIADWTSERERENAKLLLRLKFIVNAIKLPLFLLPFTQKHLLFRLLAESTSSIVTLPLGSLWRCSAFSMLDCYCCAGWSRSEGVRAHDIETTTMGCKNFAFRLSAVVVSSARAIMSHSLHNDV